MGVSFSFGMKRTNYFDKHYENDNSFFIEMKGLKAVKHVSGKWHRK